MIMRKNYFKLLVVFMILAFAVPSFAAVETLTTPAGGAGDPTTTLIGGGVFQVSTGVTLSFESDPDEYSAISYHASGSKEYGTNESSPKIFSQDKPGTASTVSLNFDFGSWD
jgi:hypothetical protein